MKWALTFAVFALSLSPARSFSQDLKLREQAVRLLERANAVSSSPKLPNLERVDTFRVFAADGVREGSFSRVVIQGIGRREEYIYGDFHLVNVWTQKKVAVSGTQGILPPELVNVLRVSPIWLVRFDGEDVIHAITDRSINGQAARCIEFDTVKGQHTDNNELCVDARTGTLVLERLAGELVENSEFFPFAGALMPAKITYSQSGIQKLEIAQTMTALADSDANVLAPPPGSTMHRICTTFRRAFGVSMPQPKPGAGGRNDDIIVRAMVGYDGRVYDVTVQSSEREDLNAEALDIAKRWTFTPSMCDGHPDAHEVDITLQFQGR